MGYFSVLTSVAGNLCNKCPSGYSNKTAVKVILSMRSLVSIKQQSTRRPCDILVANVEPEIAKTAKCVKKCAKLKIFKTALSGVSQQRSVSVCCASQFRPVQAQRPCPALFSLPQPSPADSSQARAQEPCVAAQRPRESAYHSGSFSEKLQGPGALTVPKDVPRRSTWPYPPPAYRNCAQAEKLHINSV